MNSHKSKSKKSNSSIVGGTGSADKPDQDCLNACHAVKKHVAKRLRKSLATYKPILARTQVVAGTNYFVKIHIGNEEYIHVRIYEDFDGFFELDGLQSGKHYEDEIDYFEQ